MASLKRSGSRTFHKEEASAKALKQEPVAFQGPQEGHGRQLCWGGGGSLQEQTMVVRLEGLQSFFKSFTSTFLSFSM